MDPAPSMAREADENAEIELPANFLPNALVLLLRKRAWTSNWR